MAIPQPPSPALSSDAAPSQVPPGIPRRGSRMGRLIGRRVLRAAGWRIAGALPDVRKLVVIVAPHTSNWDFIVGFSVYLALDLGATWFGKHTLFTWPFGAFFRHFGGIPIQRGAQSAAGVVDLYVQEFERRERMLLAIAPEGTRRKVTAWKSGFYRIAVQAGVPIVPAALDYGRREVRFGEAFAPSGDWDADYPRIRAHFDGVTPRHPHMF